MTVGLRVATGQLGDLAGRRVLLVGAGSLARLAGRALREAGVGELVVANRTMATGAALARELGGRAVPLDRVADELALADLAVAATAGSTPTVGAATVAEAMARRERRRGPGTPRAEPPSGRARWWCSTWACPGTSSRGSAGCPGSSWPTWTRSGPCSRPTRGRAARSSGSAR